VPLPEDMRTRILQGLTQALNVRPHSCPVCGSKNWDMPNGVVKLVVGDASTNIELSGSMLPCAVIVCRMCGSVQMFSLLAMGLTDLFPLKEE